MASSPCGSIASLVACAEFEEFAKILRDGKSEGATWRNVLAYHTSKCCAPGHQHGFLPSLKDAGIDEVHQLDGLHFTILNFGDKLFEGSPDGLPPFSCSSAVFATQLEAQEDACFFALAFLLCAVPGGVMLHPNSMKNVNVDAVREAAKAVRSAMLLQGPPVSGVFAQWSTWGESLGTQVLAPAVAPKEKIQYDASTARSPAELVALLRSPWPGKTQQLDPTRLPKKVFNALGESLKKGTFKKFLLDHQDAFIVHEAQGAKNWTFSARGDGDGNLTTESSSAPPPQPTPFGGSASAASGAEWLAGWQSSWQSAAPPQPAAAVAAPKVAASGSQWEDWTSGPTQPAAQPRWAAPKLAASDSQWDAWASRPTQPAAQSQWADPTIAASASGYSCYQTGGSPTQAAASQHWQSGTQNEQWGQWWSSGPQ